MKRITALLLCLIIALSLVACGNNQGENIDDEKIAEGKQLPDDAVVNVVIASHPSWAYEENWKVWQYIKEAMGGNVVVTAYPSSDFDTKFPLLMAVPDELPDVIGFQNMKSGFSSYCQQGAFLALDDYEEYLPNYTAFWNSVPEDKKWTRDVRKSFDGKIYMSPIYGMDRATNIRAWLYREDIFKKHDLKIPETMDDLYTVCKKLKEIYPDSYPLVFRSGIETLSLIGSEWKPYFKYNMYYDFNAEKWCFGAREDTMYDMVSFFRKMVDEGLVPPDFFTIKSKSWEELISTNRGFITADYQTRIDFFNSLGREQNPEFSLTAMIPPKAMTETGSHLLDKTNYDTMGFSILNTGDETRIRNAFRYLDWFYSDEGCETVSWGKEGETYEVVNGEKKFILPQSTDLAKNLYGFQTIGTYLRIDEKAAEGSCSKELNETTDFILEYSVDNMTPSYWMQLSDEDSSRLSDLNTSVGTFVKENITKFIIGQRPMSEWDAFQSELAKLPIDDILKIYEEAYNKIK